MEGHYRVAFLFDFQQTGGGGGGGGGGGSIETPQTTPSLHQTTPNHLQTHSYQMFKQL